MKENRAFGFQKLLWLMIMISTMGNCRHFGPSTLSQQLGGWNQDHGQGCAAECTTTEEKKRAG
eukprot:15426558-Heterocapsa_arctica.AAC.1